MTSYFVLNLPFYLPGHAGVVRHILSCRCTDIELHRLLDIIHAAMVCLANWSYLIDHFGDDEASKRIAWCAATFQLRKTLVDATFPGPYACVPVSRFADLAHLIWL